MKKKKPPAEIKPAAPPPRRSIDIQWWPWIAAAIGLFIVFEIYTPALNGRFVFDDFSLPFFSPTISDKFSGWVGFYRPLLMLSYWLDFRLWHAADQPIDAHAFHATNVFFHFLASVFAALIVWKLLEWAEVKGRMRAALALFSGALFLLHPLQTESVAYVAERGEDLSVMFYYAAFAVFLYRRTESITLLRSLAVIILFGAALASKEHTLTLPVLLLLTDYFWGRGGLRKNIYLYAPFAVGAAIGGAFVYRILRESATAGFHLRDLTPVDFFLTECRVFWIYVRLFFLPFGQNIDPDIPVSHGPLDHGAIFGFLALAALIAAAWIYRKRFPLAAFGVFVFILLLAPTSSIVPLRDVMAERRMYLPFIGLLLVACEILRRIKFEHVVGIGAAVLVICSVLTYQRSQVWADPLALWRDSVSKSPDKYRPRFQLAYAQFEHGQCPASAQSYEAASRLGPIELDLLVNWALALECSGKWEQAIDKLREAQQRRNDAHIHSQIAMVYAKHKRIPEALEELATAERLDPNYDVTYLYRGNIDELQGDRAGAAREYMHALRLNPQLQPAREALTRVAAGR